MEPISNALREFVRRFVPLQTLQTPQSVLTLSNQQRNPAPWVIPASPTLQRLTDPVLQAKARQYLAQLGEKPTGDQWKMILAATTSTRICAGAGSGKSTTLILRLLIIHKLLGIPLDEMHVFSFTTASVMEFREKLKEKLIRWEEVIEQKKLTDQERAGIEKLIERTVSTFHSVLFRLQKDVLPGVTPSSEIFDTLKEEKASKKKPPTLPEEDFRSENPFLSANLSARQDEVLNLAHSRAYRESERYRELMMTLRREQDRLYWLKVAASPMPESAQKIKYWNLFLQQEWTYHGYDEDWEYDPQPGYHDKQDFPYVDPYRAAVADWLIERNINFTPLAPFSLSCPIPGLDPGELQASFQIDEQLFLHIERYSAPQQSRKPEEQKLAYHERDRRRFIAANSDIVDQHKTLKLKDFETTKKGEPPRLKPDAQRRLRQWINLSTNALSPTDAPIMLIHLPGNIGESDIKELLYQEGVFIESMGLEVEQLRLPTPGSVDPISYAIAEALPIFWSAFREELKQWKYIRFHDILTRLRDEQVLRDVLDKMKHLRHLFIDEFQDISPEIVDWLAKTLRVQVEEGVKSGVEVSVTAIGDDYQSIYGWRGSHPTFLMSFDHYFPSPSMGDVLLLDNFRSRQPIIEAAEAVLVPVEQKTSKQGKSVFQGSEQGNLDPVRLVEARLTWKPSAVEGDIWSVFCSYSSTVLRDLEVTGYLTELMGMRQNLSVYILARSNATRRSIPADRSKLRSRLFNALQQQGIKRFRLEQIQIRSGTFHYAKGLEADLVLLLDDPKLPDEEYSLRELVFRQTNVFGPGAGTYKQNMTDEIYRLSYVALTRARLAVMWMPLTERQTEDDEQLGVNGANQAVSPQGCFILVKNYLQSAGRMQI